MPALGPGVEQMLDTAHRWPSVSARARIVGQMLVIVIIALAGSLFATAQVLSVRADEIANDRLTHAAQNFRAFTESPAGSEYATVDALLTRYLRSTVPNRGETAFSVIDDAPSRRTPGDPLARLDADPEFIARVAGLSKPESGTTDSAAGMVTYAAIPVTVEGDSHQGVLVHVLFRDELVGPLYESVRIFAIVAIVALLIAGAASWLVAGRVLEPVRLVRHTAERISESDLRRRIPVRGKDDVARLAATFNQMLDRLEVAFEVQRDFIDDAGHELRTPITVVRGHLELISDEPAQRAQTMDLVMDELNRMNRIVDDLLLLAKSEQPDFLEYGNVNVTDLTVDTLANARVLGERQWGLDEFAESGVRADGQRLRQALMQLLTNAVQHTQAGDGIAIGSRITDDRLRLWVRDTGSGINAQDVHRVFERFQRGSRARRGEGAGLGLAIVRSIAEAHGGTVHADSTPDEGSVFVLDLPAHRVDEGETGEGEV